MTNYLRKCLKLYRIHKQKQKQKQTQKYVVIKKKLQKKIVQRALSLRRFK